MGTLSFHDSRDLAFNASYIMINNGRLQVGTEAEPFMHKATITITGDRVSHELPIYGAKCIGVRNGILDMHGAPRVAYTKLAVTAIPGDTTITVTNPVDWEAGDLIAISSTAFDQEQAETVRVWGLSADGLNVYLAEPLKAIHEGEGWHSDDGSVHEVGYRASVGLLTRNVVVTGDYEVSRREQFGVQVVLHSRGDNSLIGRLSNVEVRNAGQGLKLGKYPIHFHMIGEVSWSYVRNCSIHHTFNRGIAVHGVTHLTVQYNVLFDTRGHSLFLEDGTEMYNVIEYNLNMVVRPVWSLLTVDQSPACYWIVNPMNYVRGNICAGSSHYGFWYRALEHPDGVSGAEIGQADMSLGVKPATAAAEITCPNHSPLGAFSGNVAHSTGKFGLKLSQYFPVVGGYECGSQYAVKPVFPSPAVFEDFLAFKNGLFGIWGENIVDVHFDGLRLFDHGMAGMEFIYMNGKYSQMAHSKISNSLFVGYTNTNGRPASAGTRRREMPSDDEGRSNRYLRDQDHREATIGLDDRDQLDNEFVHALHVPGASSLLTLSNCTVMHYDAAFLACVWCSIGRGGFEVKLEKMTYIDVDQWASWSHYDSGTFADLDGSTSGAVTGNGAAPAWIAPPNGQLWDNPHCQYAAPISGRPHCGWQKRNPDRVSGCAAMAGAYVCSDPIRRFSMAIPEYGRFTSPYEASDKDSNRWPRLTVTDITALTVEQKGTADVPRKDFTGWWHTHPVTAPYGIVRNGILSCLEMSPHNELNFLLAVGRKYLLQVSAHAFATRCSRTHLRNYAHPRTYASACTHHASHTHARSSTTCTISSSRQTGRSRPSTCCRTSTSCSPPPTRRLSAAGSRTEPWCGAPRSRSGRCRCRRSTGTTWTSICSPCTRWAASTTLNALRSARSARSCRTSCSSPRRASRMSTTPSRAGRACTTGRSQRTAAYRSSKTRL